METTNMHHSKITVDGCNAAISDTGGDHLPVFLFHGNSSSRKVYSELILRNSGKYRLIAVDFPGHGDTPLPDWALDGVSISRIGSFAYSVINHFGFNDFVVVGQSIGGHALIENDNIIESASGICLLSSPPINEHTIGQAFLESPVMPLLFQGELNSEELDALCNHFIYRDKPRLASRILTDLKRTDTRFRSLLGLGMETEGIKDELCALGKFRHDVLMIRGSHDGFIASQYYDSIQEVPLWKDTLFEFDCGHCISLEAPQLLWNCLSEYIDSVCPS